MQADEQLAAIRRDMLVTAWMPLNVEEEAVAADRVMKMRTGHLRALIQGCAGVGPLTDEQLEEAERVRKIVTTPVSLAAFCAADRVPASCSPPAAAQTY